METENDRRVSRFDRYNRRCSVRFTLNLKRAFQFVHGELNGTGVKEEIELESKQPA